MSRFLISVGYGETTDYIDLMDGHYGVVDGSWQPGAYDPVLGIQTHSIDVLIVGETAAERADLIRQIQTKFNQARTAAGRIGRGTPVTFGVELNSGNWVYFPFMRNPTNGLCGEIVPGVRYMSNTIQIITLYLNTWFYALGDEVRLLASGAIGQNQGTSAGIGTAGQVTLMLDDIEGDVDCPVTFIIRDNSTGSKAINSFRIGRRTSGADQFAAAINITPSGSGTSIADATNSFGGSVARTTIDADWKTVGNALGGTPGYKNRGIFDLIARVRDAATIQPPTNFNTNYSANAGTGWPRTSYQFWLTARDAGGEESAAVTDTLTIGSLAYDAITFNWIPSSGPTAYRLYWLRAGNTLRYYDLGTTPPYTVLAEPTGTAIPAIPEATGNLSFIRGASSLASLALPRNGNASQSRRTNFVYHLATMGQFYLPPILRTEEYDCPQWGMTLQVKANGNPGTNFDFDALFALPADEPYCHCQYPGLTSTTQYEWVIDTRFDLGTSVLLRSKADPDVVVGAADAEGYMMLSPGRQKLIFLAEMAGGEHSVQHTSFTVEVVYRPAYVYVRGS